MPDVEQAYLGLLPATEFLRLIENDNQEVLASLFYDNVRHWQEWNPVNSKIRDTLAKLNMSVYFPLFNNGVTIVAKRILPTGNKFLLEDYQIVNGCQTSFVLHESRDAVNEKVIVPVRLIATQDDNIRNAIIKATNRQTQVTEDQLFALSDFPKKLEAFFPTYKGKRKLYYERRSRQYSGATEVEKVRVVNMTALVRAFASMFLAIPHTTTRNYKALLKTMGTDIFHKDYCLEPYYASAYAHWRTVGELFRSSVAPRPRIHASRVARWRRPGCCIAPDRAVPYDREHRIAPPDNRRCREDFPETSSAQTTSTRTGLDTTTTEISNRRGIGERNAGMFLDGQGPSPAKKPSSQYSCRRSLRPAILLASFKCITSFPLCYSLVIRNLCISIFASTGQA
jgi:hypothetical protein